jgi:hypothetical protein
MGPMKKAKMAVEHLRIHRADNVIYPLISSICIFEITFPHLESTTPP